MSTENILIEECCRHYSIETSFIHKLSEHGLIELMATQQSYSIGYDQLPKLEKYMHFHYDLDVNMEGMEVIDHLLQKIQQLQMELRHIKAS